MATFFDVGEDAVAHPDLVELQRSVGQVANHSYTHPHLSRVSDERRLQELTATARALDFPNVFFRAPYGQADPLTDAALRRTGLTSVYWTLDTRDVGAPTGAIVQRALAVRPGGIILVHDGVQATVRAIAGIVEGLRQRGMCPGFLATTQRSVRAANGVSFHVTAVKP